MKRTAVLVVLAVLAFTAPLFATGNPTHQVQARQAPNLSVPIQAVSTDACGADGRYGNYSSISSTSIVTVSTADIVTEPMRVGNSEVQSVRFSVEPDSTADVVITIETADTPRGPWHTGYSTPFYLVNEDELASALTLKHAGVSVYNTPWIRFRFNKDAADRVWYVTQFTGVKQ